MSIYFYFIKLISQTLMSLWLIICFIIISCMYNTGSWLIKKYLLFYVIDYQTCRHSYGEKIRKASPSHYENYGLRLDSFPRIYEACCSWSWKTLPYTILGSVSQGTFTSFFLDYDVLILNVFFFFFNIVVSLWGIWFLIQNLFHTFKLIFKVFIIMNY